MARPSCSIKGCEYENNARGLCRTHYGAWLRENKHATKSHSPTVALSEAERDDYWLWVKNHLRLA
jgi:hypothetical protein